MIDDTTRNALATPKPISALRRRMLEDMAVRRFGEKTQHDYIKHIETLHAHDWRDLLFDIKRRGLAIQPELMIADGALGFWKAAGEVWPTAAEQRCWFHKTANVLKAAEEPASESQARVAGDLDGRDEDCRRGRVRRLHRKLCAEI